MAGNGLTPPCCYSVVTNLFPRLWKQRILLTSSGSAPSIKSTDGKHYIIIPSNLFEEFLRLGQRYYIDHRQWNEIIKFTCSMLDCCGYEGLARLDFLSHTNRFQYLKEQRRSLLVVQNEQPPVQQQQQQSTSRDDLMSPYSARSDSLSGSSNTTSASNSNNDDNERSNTTKSENNSVPLSAMTTGSTNTTSPLTSTSATSVLGINANKRTLSTLVAFMCEYMAVSSQFTQFAYDYYRAVCVLDGPDRSGGPDPASEAPDDGGSGGTGGAGGHLRQEKACLIPICAIQSSSNLVGDHWKKAATPSTATSARRESQGGGSTATPSASSSASTPLHQLHQNKKSKLDDLPGYTVNSNQGSGLNSNCMEGVDQTLQILSRAADCLRHLVTLWDWAVHSAPDIDWTTLFGGWETEFTRVIDAYQLPFDIYNAILLVRSDLALSTVSKTKNAPCRVTN